VTDQTIIHTFAIHSCPAGWRDWFFLTFETSSGTQGTSEFTESNGPKTGLLTTVHEAASQVIGCDPRDVENITKALRRQFQQSLGGTTWKAIAAVENALWDLRSKLEGVTISHLIDGKSNSATNSIPVYWSHCGTSRIRASELIGRPPILSISDLQKIGEEVVSEKFSAFKTNIFDFMKSPKVLMPGFSPEVFAPELVGKDKHFLIEDALDAFTQNGTQPIQPIVDLNYNVEPSSYKDLISRIQRFEPKWIEIDFRSQFDLKNLPMTSEVPICTGENLLGLDAYEPYLRSRKISIISIDLLWNGLSESVLIARRALAMGKKVTVHNYYSHFATSMALTFAELLSDNELLEFDYDDVPWRENIVTKNHRAQEGQIQFQSSLGWGNEIKECVIGGLTSERVESYRALVNSLTGFL